MDKTFVYKRASAVFLAKAWQKCKILAIFLLKKGGKQAMGWLFERRWRFNNGRRNMNKIEEDCERWQPVSAWPRS